MRVLVTGGTGTVAKALARKLPDLGHDVRLTLRQPVDGLPAPSVVVGEIDGDTDWGPALVGIDVVVHLAAQAPIPGTRKRRSRASFMAVNRDGTARLAEQAAAGVGRMVFISSVLACGNKTLGERPFSDDDQPDEWDAYGVSKREGERAFERVAEKTGLDGIILRLPPVYGPGVQNNILTLFKAVSRGVPLPLKSIRNALNFVFIDNLTTAIALTVDRLKAPERTYFLCDRATVTTPEFISRIAEAMQCPARLFPCPVPLLRLAGMVTRQDLAVGRLVNSLRVDSSRFIEDFGWEQEFTMDEGLRKTAVWFAESNG